MIKKLHEMGVRSDHMYIAGAGSIILACGAWLMSKNAARSGLDRADRWGIFIGEWAPTFVALGVALRIEETHRDLAEPGAEMFERAEAERSRAGV
ncbi:hypothetical protein ACFOY2_05770 [Nonomuraea purpurea]|uniref:Uncharacterized protein n=1 Tax=Nonomuraea purpurea TaxID=1849276 RepID=A0ABV8G3C9_9ACTN